MTDAENKNYTKDEALDPSQTYSELDELLANPFDQDLPGSYFEKDLMEAEVLAQKTVANERLIDRLPEHRQKQAQDLSKQIDENNPQAIIAYGANAQKKLSDFSKSMLNQVKIKDTGEISDALAELMKDLEAHQSKDLLKPKNFFQRLLGKARQSITESQVHYQKLGAQLDRIAIRLDREKDQLMNDNLMLEQFYSKNRDYFDALNIYIAAAEVKMAQLQNEVIPAAIQQAKSSKSQLDIQKVNDLNQFLDRLDKRTHDLRLTRQMTLQQAPQIRLIQNTNQVLAEKIHVSIHTAIPLWENQVMISLAILRQQQASNSQQIVTETTNKLLLENSEMLKQSTLDVAGQAERGVIDLETLQKAQDNLVSTLKETLSIQESGRQQRRLAEQELLAMEDELKNSLLAISKEQKAKPFDPSELDHQNN